MSRRTATWLAWSMCALSLALAALSLLLLYLNYSHPGVPIWEFWAPNTLITVGFSTVGAVIASHLPPKNPIGWVFCAIGLLIGVTHFSAQYAIYTLLAAPGSLPAGEAAAWVWSWVWVPGLGLSTFQYLLFPDGRLPSPRWRWFAWLSLLLILGGTISQAFAPGVVQGVGGIYNPLGVERLPNVGEPIQTLLFALMLISATSLFVRQWRASGAERQQLKWFTYSATVAVIGLILTATISGAIGSVWLGWAGNVIMIAGLLGIPIAMGIAILRYRLYDIDVVINRTLVYGALTATLVAVYFGGVAATQAIFRTLTGQQEQPQLAIVVSTLVIAALFTPLRRRIQGFIDRRFYRSKYDARKALEAFSARLRDETDLEALNAELVEVVRETIQPAHVSLWLRPDKPYKGEQAD